MKSVESANPGSQHDSEDERARADDVTRLVPHGYRTALDAGARDGYLTSRIIPLFEKVTALDLHKPNIEGVECIQGNLTHLEFPDDSFDFVLCTEVLEHIPEYELACREIVRVCRHSTLIGVPYKQDIRVGRATCQSCGKISPPWGHVNTFTEEKLERLFAPMQIVKKSFVGYDRSRTNPFSIWLMDRAGNPWGAYGSDQFCAHCGAVLSGPKPRTLLQRCCSAAALRIRRLQERVSSPHANWIHVVFEKTTPHSRKP